MRFLSLKQKYWEKNKWKEILIYELECEIKVYRD